MTILTATANSSIIPRCTTLIMDIGDVLVTMSLETSTSIPPKTLRTILTSPTWGKYECGKLSELECYQLAAEEHCLNVDEVTRAFHDVRDSITLNEPLFEFLSQLKAELGGNFRLYAMSNISKPDIELLVAKHAAEWAVFDQIFPSAEAGMRKPSLGFYRHVLDAMGGDPKEIVYVDDKAENVLVARSFGTQGAVYSKLEDLRKELRYFLCDPIRRGAIFLHEHASMLDFATTNSISSDDRLARIVAVEAIEHIDVLVSTCLRVAHNQLIAGIDDIAQRQTLLEAVLDVDAAALSLFAPGYEQGAVNAVMDAMLQLRDEDGIIQTFVDSKCGRADPVICANVLALFYCQNRDAELAETQAWVLGVLKHRGYLNGTRYYSRAESFLYALSRLVLVENDALHHLLRPLLKERLQELIGQPGDAAVLAMRVLACANVGIPDVVDAGKLLSMQLEDGSWTAKKNRGLAEQTDASVESRCFATALAVGAVCKVEEGQLI
ncbi:HAD-like domain-containing protein [Cytidiella melzeri]|nr:HAD-like domain-containing protein [Cytidiella melzeri]